ncbi:MAG: hypothetical protein SCALA702_32410 [Melioribacteraceae bacterium]|nr:MAG: hypothetical protein SCALA702_32410 [Melioribacteraceae bacterium]
MNSTTKKQALVIGTVIYNFAGLMHRFISPEHSKSDFILEFYRNNFESRRIFQDINNYLQEFLSGTSTDNFPIRIAEEINSEINRFSGGSSKVNHLIPVLSRVNFKEELRSDGEYYYMPRKLSKSDVFPNSRNGLVSQSESEQKYRDLFNEFVSELNLIPDFELTSFTDSLLYLFEKYAVYLPVSTEIESPDVSLYDHCKTVAAIAIAKEFAEVNNDKDFLIIAADISGIQKFIYNDIAAKPGSEQKSKRLRGKSFYLSILTDLFTSYILDGLELPRTNLLMSGGGHFIIMAPNSEENKKIVSDCSREIQKWFYKTFKGDLNLIIQTIEADDELYKNFPLWYNEISGKLQSAKKQRSFENLSEVFGYDLDVMDISEYKFLLNKSKEYKSDYEDSSTTYEKNLALLSIMFEEMGKKLTKLKYYCVLTHKEGKNVSTDKLNVDFILPFPKFSKSIVFAASEDEVSNLLRNCDESSFTSVTVLRSNNSDFMDNVFAKNSSIMKIPFTFGFNYMGNSVPVDEHSQVLEFEKLAELNNEDGKTNSTLEYKLLGTLRMDVDNLGAIFSQGLERNKSEESIRTLTRTVALSREFNLFFGGYLNDIAARWRVYITYSGGDDLFVVGSWINIIGFALDVKDKFTEFACHNSEVTISGGVSINKPSFPIGRAAQNAGEAEELAKSFPQKKRLKTIKVRKQTEHEKKVDEKNPEETKEDTKPIEITKNAIAVFDQAFSWTEMKLQWEYGKALDALVDRKDRKIPVDEEIKPSFLHFLLQQTKKMVNEEGEFNVYQMGLLAKIKYMIARRGATSEKINKNDSNRRILELSKLINNNSSDKYLENFVIPASYVVLKNRENK